jgi:hypothetical protein
MSIFGPPVVSDSTHVNGGTADRARAADSRTLSARLRVAPCIRPPMEARPDRMTFTAVANADALAAPSLGPTVTAFGRREGFMVAAVADSLHNGV